MSEPKKRTDAGMDTIAKAERVEEAAKASEEATEAQVIATEGMLKATKASTAATDAANEATRRQLQATHTVKIVYVLSVVAIAAIGAGASIAAPEQAVPILAFCGSIIVALIPLMKGQSEVNGTVKSQMEILMQQREKAALAEGEATGRRLQKDEHEAKSEGSE